MGMFEERQFKTKGSAHPSALKQSMRMHPKIWKEALWGQSRASKEDNSGQPGQAGTLGQCEDFGFPSECDGKHRRILSQVVCDSKSLVLTLCGNASLFS